MADFVAVIRRAVDGLANNTPEARVRVYDKARGAVQRQLENMKPRPPEEMLRRQLDKLEAAITEVETEHSEALPAEPAPAAPVPVAAPVDVHQEPEPVAYEAPAAPVAQEVAAPVTATEPVVRDEPEAPAYAEPEVYEAPEPVASAPVEQDWRHEPAVEPEPEPQQAWEEPAPASEAPASAAADATAESQRYGDWRDDVPEEHAQPAPAVPAWATISDEQASAFELEQEEAKAEPAVDHGHAWQAEEPVERQEPAAPTEQWTWSEPEQTAVEPVAHHPDEASQTRADAAWNDVGDLVAAPDRAPEQEPAYEPPQLSAAHSETVAAHFDQEIHASAQPVRMPSASDLPDLAATPAQQQGGDDPFEAYVNSQPAAVSVESKKDDKDPWSDLEDLIGYTKEAPAAEPQAQAETTQPGAGPSQDDLSDLLAPPAKPYRATPKPKRNYAGMALGLLALCLLGGAGYAAWLNRDSLNDLVGGLMEATTGSETADAPSSATPSGDTSANAPQTTPPAETQPTQTPPAQSNAPVQGNTAPQTGTPPAADGSTTATKFTQRLTQDGTEVDEGPGELGSLAQNAEGQSVAQLNTPPADAGAATPPAGAAATTAPGAAATTPAAAGERMFLYEERIGQSAPTAIEGSVSWSLQRQPAENGGALEPVVQGRITIPGRGLIAQVSVQRNTDSSLPASHLIEIVFDVPPDFEGGAIDSVLRIAMKQTEQDRGNALVAVPAKITDDLHMIALNDFPDARATNLELLRSRDWMDIPVVYRNGRRALLTLQKGPEGKAAFDEAIREWSQQSGQ